MTFETFVREIPKAELHLHIEGTLEPELLFALAKRNGIPLTYPSVEELRKAYQFSNLQDFLDIYYEGASVLMTEQDFFDLALAYFTKAHEQNIRHAEIFFDPQTHTDRGIAFAAVIRGLHRAQMEAEQKWGITSKLIMCFLRHLDPESAMRTLESALPYKALIAGVGLDSGEQGNPPSKFIEVFARAREEGFLPVAHAGEEGPATYVREALDLLHVLRIDHGNHALDDDALVHLLALRQIPLTVCPLSNLKLAVVTDLSQHPLRRMMDAGLLVTINSDDPAYFGGYAAENYRAVAEACALSREEIRQLAANSFRASFLPEDEKARHIAEVSAFDARF
jgi:adenosine deaminase